MVTLKEGLSSGAILAQFDVRGTLQICSEICICKHVMMCCVVPSNSNCTGRGQGWRCCVPNYLRMFPKIATETSPHVRILKYLLAWTFSQPFSHVLTCFPPPRVIFSVRAVSAPLSLFVSLCRWRHTGHSEKHRWLHQCKLHQCECLHHVFFLSFNMSVDIFVSDWELVGWSVSLAYETQVKTFSCDWWIHQTSPTNHSL